MSVDKIVWSQRKFLSFDEVKLGPYFRGLQFGDGLFETLRSDNGKTHFPKEHLERLETSCHALNINFNQEEKWNNIISQLLALNDLHQTTARIKIIICRGNSTALGLPTAEDAPVIIQASEYSPPSETILRQGLNLVSYSSDYPNNMANHKSLNYMFNMISRQYALSFGYHEAILLDREERISETSTGSLLFSDGKTWIIPESYFQLPGITISQVGQYLTDRGETCLIEPVLLTDIDRFTKAFVLNSLTGAVPVHRIDKKLFADKDVDFSEEINRFLFY